MVFKFTKKLIALIEIIIIGICILYTINYFSTNIDQKILEQEINSKHYNKIVKSIFKEIYGKNLWEKHGLGFGGGSGWGSSLNYTKNTRDIIIEVIKKYRLKSMLDAPCGSGLWMSYLLKNITLTQRNFRYLGVDIVDTLIDDLNIKFSESKKIKFLAADFTQSLLVADSTKNEIILSYELILSRDGFQHLPLSKTVDALASFSKVKGARYLLVSSYMKNNLNRNIRIGDYFPINLTIHPFNMTEYVSIFKEVNAKKGDDQKYLLLYDIPNYLSKLDFDKIKHESNKIK